MLAGYVVRNEIVTEHFLTQELPVSPIEIGEKVNEIDEHLGEETLWQDRFPNLFPDA